MSSCLLSMDKRIVAEARILIDQNPVIDKIYCILKSFNLTFCLSKNGHCLQWILWETIVKCRSPDHFSWIYVVCTVSVKLFTLHQMICCQIIATEKIENDTMKEGHTADVFYSSHQGRKSNCRSAGIFSKYLCSKLSNVSYINKKFSLYSSYIFTICLTFFISVIQINPP